MMHRSRGETAPYAVSVEDPTGMASNRQKGRGATRRVASFLFAGAIILAGCGSANATDERAESRSPAVSGQPFPDAGRSSSGPTSTAPAPEQITTSSTTPAGGQGGAAKGGPSIASCDARYELGPDRKTLDVLILTDIEPPETLYTGYLADDSNGHAVGKMWRGNHFTTQWNGVTPLAFIAIDAATLPPGTLTGPTGTLPPGQMGYLWCGTLFSS